MAKLLPFFCFLLLAVAVAATSPVEVYWKSVLPGSEMPSAIRDLINTAKPAASASSSSNSDDSVASIFFVEKDLHANNKMTLHFTSATAGAVLLARHVADAAPFTQSAVTACNAEPAAAGEEKLCATSLQSMVDFAAAGLGTRDVHAISTSVSSGAASPKQTYTLSGVRALRGDEMVACHGMGSKYVVFGCHTTKAAAYAVSLAGEDGTKVEAVAACHVDAAPGVAEAYKKLNVKPGSVPVCHFLPQSDLLWVRI